MIVVIMMVMMRIGFKSDRTNVEHVRVSLAFLNAYWRFLEGVA